MFVPQPHAAAPFPARTRAAVPARPAPRSFETGQVELLVSAPDGDERMVPAYLAVVDGRAYLRPRGGGRCSWVRGVASGCALSIVVGGAPIPARVRSVRDDEVQRRITAELLNRFGYDAAMPSLLEAASLERTVELVPEAVAARRALAA